MEAHDAGTPVPTKTILVVDDDERCSTQLAELLRVQGYPAVSLTSGPAALAYIEAHGPPGLILLDIMMPEMNGIEVLSRVRERYPAVPVCLITALYDEALLRAAMRLGAYECVTKPFDMEYLQTAVLVKMATLGRDDGRKPGKAA